MLWDASAVNGYTIEASDGRLGTVRDLLFEDVNWVVRWLVVDTGHWLSGRKVLLPLSALEQPDLALRHFPVKLTMQQVKESPDIDTDRPVSRQVETHIFDYFGWDPYWSEGYTPMGSGRATAFPASHYGSGSKPLEPDRTRRDSDGGDPHLCSIAAITGYHIHATDGEIGHAVDFLVDDDGWHIRYIKVGTRNWWPGERVLISPPSVREIDWANRLIHLNVSRQKVKGSPPYSPSMTVDGAYHEKFLTYYGIRWVAP